MNFIWWFTSPRALVGFQVLLKALASLCWIKPFGRYMLNFIKISFILEKKLSTVDYFLKLLTWFVPGNQVQVDPYLEDSMCDICHTTSGPFFCREESCFKYYCHSCWLWHHSIEGYRQHRYWNVLYFSKYLIFAQVHLRTFARKFSSR